MADKFSSILSITGMDHIGPSQECIKPIVAKKSQESKPARIQLDDGGGYTEVFSDGTSNLLETAKISLHDCLACSGCITSAESILITAQSLEEFHANLRRKDTTFVVSISPQSRASLAAHFNLNLHTTFRKLVTFLKSQGINYVMDTSWSRDVSLLEMQAEFMFRYQNPSKDKPLPMLVSSCPGWICYAEKRHSEFILPYISTTKSPQQIMGTVVKNYFAQQLKTSAEKIFHVTIMPCYDKKLEASREDFYNNELKTRDVDCVLTSGEVLDLINQTKTDFLSLSESIIDQPFSNVDDQGQVFGTPGGSGGYVETIFRYAAKELADVDFPIDKPLEYKTIRNQDYKCYSLEIPEKPQLQFATAYGFRNIQNLVRTIKSGKCPYQFIEVMACPSGCVNGGGQIAVSTKDPVANKNRVSLVDALYHQQRPTRPEENIAALSIYNSWVTGGIYSERAKALFHTQYHRIEPLSNPLVIKW